MFVRNHPSRYDTVSCNRCGAEVIIPGGYLNWALTKKKRGRPPWYFKPCPIPPKIEYDIDGQTNALVWFQYWWENGEVVKSLRPSNVSLAEMVNDHFIVNAHTNSADFYTGWVIDNWGTVRLIDHGGHSIGSGLWLNDEVRLERAPITQDTPGAIYDPLWGRWRIFVSEHSFLGSVLPPDIQRGYIANGLARSLYPDKLEPLIAQYAEGRPFLDLTEMIRTARIERERRRLAAGCRQRHKPGKTDPRQRSMF